MTRGNTSVKNWGRRITSIILRFTNQKKTGGVKVTDKKSRRCQHINYTQEVRAKIVGCSSKGGDGGGKKKGPGEGGGEGHSLEQFNTAQPASDPRQRKAGKQGVQKNIKGKVKNSPFDVK